METKTISAMSSGSTEEAAKALTTAVRSGLGSPPALAILFASTAQPLADLLGKVQESFPETPVLGCSTAGEFTGEREANGSVSLFALAGDFRVHVGMGTGLKASTEAAIQSAIENLPPAIEGYPHRTAVMLIDGLQGVGEEATLLAMLLLGPDVPIAGAAAGDDWQVKSTLVGCGARASADAVAIAMIYSKKPLGIGVAHGHRPFSKPMKITKAVDNVVHEIDGRSAWDTWVDGTREEALKDGVDPTKIATPGESLKYFARFEAGIRVGQEFKIRPPLVRIPDGSLGFACGIPEGTEIVLMRSGPEEQVTSARAAAKRARAQLNGAEIAGALVFDCACRKALLEDRFFSAVEAVSKELGGATVAGFESYGEIALNQGDFSGFHNATTVILAFPK
jgi:hypothetical protein